MTTQQQNSRFKHSIKSMLILSLVVLFSCSYRLAAQQKDGDETTPSANSSTNTAPNRSNVNFSFNFANLTLQNGEFLEMFGANNSRGILRGHPTIPGAELGTTTADPLIFSTNGIERMRIWPDGTIGIGTTALPAGSALDFATTSTIVYVPQGLHPSRMRLFNTATHLNATAEFNLGSFDTNGGNSTRARLVMIATNNTPGATAGDFAIGLRNAGAMFEHTRFVSNGSVGIGTASPTQKLDVQGGAINASGGLCIAGDCKTAWSQVGGGSQWTTSGTSIFYNGGNVGIGTGAPNAKLFVAGVAPNGTAVFVGSTFASHFNYNGDGSESTYIRGGKAGSGVIINDTSAGPVLVALGGGNVGVGTASPTAKLHVQGAGRITGNLVVDGNIAAKYQDVAEWVPAAEQLSAGTVVVLNSSKANQVISSNQSYDTRVAGVISAQPGITLGEKSDEKVLVATTGRVLVNVDATSGPIQIGDLLVTSDREGFAMKSQPLEIGGARLHRPGTLIGKALEPLAGGTGKILVLLSLQ